MNVVGSSKEFKEAVVPFSGNCFLRGASSSYLNSVNSESNTLLGKTVRCLGRSIYALAVMEIAAPAGIVYHTIQALECFFAPSIVRSELKERTWQHLNAAWIDTKVFVGGNLATIVGVLWATNAIFAGIQMEWLAFGVLGIGSLVIWKFSPVVKFMVDPETFSDYLEKHSHDSIVGIYLFAKAGLEPPQDAEATLERYGKIPEFAQLVDKLLKDSFFERALLQQDEARAKVYQSALTDYCQILMDIKSTYDEAKTFLKPYIDKLEKLSKHSSYNFMLKDLEALEVISKLVEWQKTQTPSSPSSEFDD